MKTKTKVLILILVIILVSLSVWGMIKISKNAVNKQETTKDAQANVEKSNEKNKKAASDINYLKRAEIMSKAPEKGEQIAIMTVKNFGEIKFKFFPEVAPKAVENFITHSKNGYYNGLTFHRVINDFMIQGGDPKGNGTGGESIWGEGFAKEVSDEYIPIRGTLCMASSSRPNSLGSQFFITQSKFNKNVAAQAQELSQNLVDAYTKFGGVPSLHKGYTIFGYAYEGIDVVDKIAEIKTDSSDDKPTTPVVIEKIEITNAK